MELEIAIEEPWPSGEWEGLADRAASAAGEIAPELAGERLSASLLFTSDEEIHALNREWRQRDKPTNVLSFPSPATQPGPARTIGDIAISYETAAREAASEGKSFTDHVAHLAVHGFLHLLGYDHIEPADAAMMEPLEAEILAGLGLPDPYAGGPYRANPDGDDA